MLINTDFLRRYTVFSLIDAFVRKCSIAQSRLHKTTLEKDNQRHMILRKCDAVAFHKAINFLHGNGRYIPRLS